MRPLAHQIAVVTVALMVLLVSLSLLSYAQWVRGIAVGDRALQNQDLAAAEAAYTAAVTRAEHIPLPSIFLRSRYRTLVFNRARLFDARHNYDALARWLEAAASHSPAIAAAPEYHFWTGVVEYEKAIDLKDKRAVREGLQRASEDFRLALESDPNDWDTKYNYELTARLLERMQNKKEESQQKVNRGGMKILREDPDKTKEQQQKLAPDKQS